MKKEIICLVCPCCGMIDAKGTILEEIWEEHTTYTLNPRNSKYEEKDREAVEFLTCYCNNCGSTFIPVTDCESPLEAIKVKLIDTDKKVIVVPLGGHYKLHQGLLYELLRKQFKDKEIVVNVEETV